MQFLGCSIWFLGSCYGVTRLLLLVSRCCGVLGGSQCVAMHLLVFCLVSRELSCCCLGVLFSFLGVAMQLLGCSDWFPGSCYVVARAFWGVFPKKHH